MAESYNERRTILVQGLLALPGITLVPPNGAFYAFPQLPDGCGDSVSFCKKALEEEGLAIVPGGAFGDDRCVRLSCAVSRETIADGLSRLARLLPAG
tara:strand:- start:564 stop:854 length:291 start_codon:yes stop_codon:yes gene_type:complete